MNLLPTDINLRALLERGHEAIEYDRAQFEKSQAGVLRAGSAGCLVTGVTMGECHRIAHLRHLGHDKPMPTSRRLMLQGGEGNEDLIEKTLEAAWPGHVARDVMYMKLGPWGTVSGRPDIVLLNDDRSHRLVLELKLVSSLNSAIARSVNGEPDSKHLVQSAVYMWLTGLPAILCYANRADFAVQFQAKKLGVSKVEPGYRLFYLAIRDGTLFFRDEQSATETPTMVTVAGIEAYYQRVADMAAAQTLHDRPSNYSVTGAAGAWERCDPRYCAFADACDKFEGDYHTWIDAAARICLERGE